MKVPFIDLCRHHKTIKNEIATAFNRVYENGNFILGSEVREFENEIAEYIGVNYAIGVSNCTNALMLSLKVLDIKQSDEILIPAFTFIATAEVVSILGATPVFCDIDQQTFNICPDSVVRNITKNSKAIIPVHLYGQAAAMDEIMSLANTHNLKVIEDMAQAIGATYKGRKVGQFGDTACVSFFPTKNLSALGDGGMIFTNNKELESRIRTLRVHGAMKKYHHDVIGYNERLDAIQAAFLRVKLNYLDDWNSKRSEIAQKYNDGLTGIVQIPYIHEKNISVYHQYTIKTEKRDELVQYLNRNGIGTAIHYPIPLHLQKAFAYLGHKEGDYPEAEKASKEVLSLPIQHTLTDTEINYVIKSIRQFFNK